MTSSEGDSHRRLRVLLVCSNGGHLAQLVKLAPWWRQHDRLWVTFPQADARQLLADEQVRDAYFPTTRNIPNLLRNFGLAHRVLREFRPDVVVSTGAGVALPFFLLARGAGVATVYLEVFDRIDSPTLTGRLCTRFTDAFCLQWEEQRRSYPQGVVVGPVYGTSAPQSAAVDVPENHSPGRRTVFVTVGTDHHRFDRLIDWTERWAGRRDDVDLVVQHGTSRPVLGARNASLLGQDEVLHLMSTSTAVVTQGGPGSIMDCREAGRLPIVVPRRATLDEHVDDHQLAFTSRLAEDGYLLLAEDESELTRLLDAAMSDPRTVRLPSRGPVPIPETIERLSQQVERVVVDRRPPGAASH